MLQINLNHKTNFGSFALYLFLAACSNAPEFPQKSVVKAHLDTNVLLITVDTLRADHVSCYGSKSVATPNMDALASRGVRFAQAIAQVPLTTPSHACILTGTYPQVHKLRDNGGFILDSQIPTLATITHEAGLQTAAIVGAGVLHHQFGMNRGFDTYQDEMNERASADLLPGVIPEIRGEIVARRALEWLESKQKEGIGVQPGKNFFLWVHFYDPHFPYDPPQPFRSRYSKDLYSGEVAYADEQVGKLMKALTDLGLQERTLVMLMADHGEGLGDHGEFTHGVFLYDETVHVPMLMAGPRIPSGRLVSQQVRAIDVMPTILDYLGLLPGTQAQGTSLMPAAIQGQSTRTNYAYMETLYPKTSHGWSELRAVRTDEYKLIIAPTSELYQLVQDPGESHNIKSQYPAEADRLEKKVWEVAGPPESQGKLERRPVDEQTLRQLQSLGYASAGARKDLKIDRSGPDPKDRVYVLKTLDRVASLMNHDQFVAAIPLLEEIARQDATNPVIYSKLGTCYQRTRQYTKASQVYQKAIHSKADTDQTHAELGNLYVRAGQLQEAVASMEQAAEMNMTGLQNLANLATAYLNLGRFPETERVLKAILIQNDRHAMAHNIFGILEIQKRQGPQAREHFEKAIELDPNLAEAYMNLGLLAQEAGQPLVAIDYYKKFLARADTKAHGELIPKVKEAIKELESKS